MTHGFLSTLTATLLALHTVLGCCWHHTHSCVSADHAAPTLSDECSCDDGDHDGQPAHGNKPGCPNGHECHGNTCVVAHVSKVNWPGLTLLPQSLPIASAVSGSPFCNHAVDSQAFFAADALLPPLRLHLVCHVLLI